MNHQFLKLLYEWQKPYISGTDFHHIFNKSGNSRQAIIKRATNQGYLVPVKRDLHIIKKSKQQPIDSFEIALIIYGPSYVSFESALSYYGWIPEAVRTTTCATVKRSKEFETPIGVFSYEQIPIKAFPYGIEQKPQDNATLFIASPLKALADIIYARKRSWKSLEDLCDDLRIDIENFHNIEKRLLVDLIEHYPSARVKKTLQIILKGL